MTRTVNPESTRLNFVGTITTYRYNTGIVNPHSGVGLTYELEVGRSESGRVTHATLAVPSSYLVIELLNNMFMGDPCGFLDYLEDQVFPGKKVTGWWLSEGKMYHDFEADEFLWVLDPDYYSKFDVESIDWDNVTALLNSHPNLLRSKVVAGHNHRLLEYIAGLADMLEKHALEWYANNKE